MKITKDFLEILNIPYYAWTEEVIDGQPCLVIKNPKYCRVFWLCLWRNYGLNWFKLQKIYTKLENVDLDQTVIVNAQTNEIKSAPLSLKSIEYYASVNTENDEYFNDNIMKISLNFNTIAFYYLMAFIFVLVLFIFMNLTANERFKQSLRMI